MPKTQFISMSSTKDRIVNKMEIQHPFLHLFDASSLRYFALQNRRYLGNKYKLLDFIDDIVTKECCDIKVFCDIFAGTGVVGQKFNKKNLKIISNDILKSNYIPLKAFLGTTQINNKNVLQKIRFLNNLNVIEDNYFSAHFGGTYFTIENARKIGAIREKINEISEGKEEKFTLLTSLLYATDKAANTVGHYDAYRKNLDTTLPLRLLIPNIALDDNSGNDIYNEDANQLIKKIICDVLYIDPPYNSRQYSDTYHLLENLSTWQKTPVYGKAKKMDRSHIKSEYCLKSACKAFADLISNAKCKYILVSYNNTGETKDGRSNAKIHDGIIIDILKIRGVVKVFERRYKAFTAGKSGTQGHTERIFYCKVTN